MCEQCLEYENQIDSLNAEIEDLSEQVQTLECELNDAQRDYEDDKYDWQKEVHELEQKLQSTDMALQKTEDGCYSALRDVSEDYVSLLNFLEEHYPEAYMAIQMDAPDIETNVLKPTLSGKDHWMNAYKMMEGYLQ